MILTKEQAHDNIILSDKLMVIRKIRREIIDFELDRVRSTMKENLKVRDLDQATLTSCNQKLLTSLLHNQKFINAFIRSEKFKIKIWYPMPKDWLQIINKDGKLANNTICQFLWTIYCLKRITRFSWESLVYSTKFLVRFQKKGPDISILGRKKFVFVNNYKSPLGEQGKYNFLTWFKLQESVSGKIFIHNNPEFKNSREVLYVSSFLFPGSIRNRSNLLFSTAAYIYYFMFKYNLKLSLFLTYEDLTLAQCVKNSEDLEGHYFVFLEDARLDTPIWVHCLLLRNARVIYIELSQSIEPDYRSGEQINDDFEKIVAWPEIWTVTKERISYLLKFDINKNKVFREAGLPWLTDIKQYIPRFNGPTIAVFDVEPHKGHFGVSTYNFYGLQRPAFAVKFLLDIVETANSLGVRVLLKPKREIKSKRFTEYQKCLNQLAQNYPSNFLLLDPNTSLKFIGENSNAIIATPFTSAIYAGPNTLTHRVYYDPFMSGISSSRNYDFDVILGKSDLNKWMTNFAENRK